MTKSTWDEEATTPQTPRDWKEYRPRVKGRKSSVPNGTSYPFVDDSGWREKIQRINAVALDDDAKQRFLMSLQKWGKKSLAAEAAGCTMATIKRHCLVDPEFNEAYEHALEFHRENRARILESSAMEGSVEPVFGSDGQVGERIRYETQLRVMILKGSDRDMYEDRKSIDVKHSLVQSGALVVPATLNSADWEAQFDEMRAVQELPEGVSTPQVSVVEAEFEPVVTKKPAI